MANELYTIQKSTITPLFDQIRRITETEDAMTFEGATESLLNITTGSDLPNAENAGFGDRDGDVGVGMTINVTPTSKSESSRGQDFVGYQANEALSILGIRVYQTNPYETLVRFWNSSGVKVYESELFTPKSAEWEEIYFDTPITVAIGEEFYICSRRPTYKQCDYVTIGNVSFSEKVTFLGSADYANYSSFVNTNLLSEKFVYGLVDILIGTFDNLNLPDDYQIARATMDDLANEVKRISGTAGQMNPTQMLTALQSITLQDKTVTPTAEVQTVTPDDGYYALSSVTVEAIPTTE